MSQLDSKYAHIGISFKCPNGHTIKRDFPHVQSHDGYKIVNAQVFDLRCDTCGWEGSMTGSKRENLWTIKAFRLFAHGYEMVVSQDSNGKWRGFFGKPGDRRGWEAVTSAGELTETKLSVCHQVEALAITEGIPVMDACNEALSAWTEVLD